MKRARCEIPDGGARVSSFDAHRVSAADCALWPLMCGGPRTRAEILSQVDAGALTFPKPQHTTRTDSFGWFETTLERDGALMVECGDQTIFHAPSGLDVSFTDPTVDLAREALSGLGGGIEGRLLIINPYSRKQAVVDATEWQRQPAELRAGAWVTTLDGVSVTKAPGDFTLSGVNGMFGSSLPEEPPPPSSAMQALTVRVTSHDGLEVSPLSLQVRRADAGVGSDWLETRALQHVFDVAPGSYRVLARLPGSETVERVVEVRQATEIFLTLSPAAGTNARVIDARGQPVSGAQVSCDGSPADTTDAKGFVTFVEPAARMRAVHPAIGQSTEVTITDAGVVQLTLAPTSDVEVRLEAPDGGAVFGVARVSDRETADELTRSVSVPTTFVRNGVLTLRGLGRGHHEVLVLTRDWKAAQFSLEVGNAPLRVTRRLEEKPFIEGTIVRDGKPVAAARVRFSRPDAVFGYSEDETTTDSQGRFHLGRSLPGESVLRIDATTSRLKLAVPSTGARINLDR
ncbi:MAG: hypothetical protein QM817_17265 [Archangium sp.]